MKKLLLLAILYSVTFSSKAQSITATYDPTTNKDDGRGFYTDFDFTVIKYDKFGAHIKLISHDIDYAKGFYRKYFSQPKGKFYPCSQLKGLCEETKIISIWVRFSWEYGGKTYENGEMYDGRNKAGLFTYLEVVNIITPPSDIPVEARREGKAIIKKITITSCSFSTQDKIEDVVRAINKF